MAITNHDRVGKALELLTGGLKPFVERELKSSWGDKFLDNTKILLSDTRLQARAADGAPQLDVAALLVIMDREWKAIFSQTLGKAERSMVNEVLDVRNKWAHQRPFSTDDAYRALYHLFSGRPVADLPGLEAVLGAPASSRHGEEAADRMPALPGMPTLPVKRVVIVGNKISPSSPRTKPDGTVVRTLWANSRGSLAGRKATRSWLPMTNGRRIPATGCTSFSTSMGRASS